MKDLSCDLIRICIGSTCDQMAYLSTGGNANNFIKRITSAYTLGYSCFIHRCDQVGICLWTTLYSWIRFLSVIYQKNIK